jgi:hypothetical protein
MDAHSFLLPSLGQEHLVAVQVDGRPSFSEARKSSQGYTATPANGEVSP